MSCKPVLPNEMLIKILSNTHYEDRQAVDLVCKRFRVVTASIESKMNHKLYSKVFVYFFENDTSNKFGYIKLTDEFKNVMFKNIFKDSDSKKDFFANMSKINVTEDAELTFCFHSLSQELVELKDLFQKSHNIKSISFAYMGTKEYNHFNLLCNNWTRELQTMEIWYASFESFATNTSIKLHNQIALEFTTEIEEGNFNLDLWNTYLNNNKFKSIKYSCCEFIPFDTIYSLITMFFRHIKNKRVSSIHISTNESSYTMSEIDDFISSVRSDGFQTVKTYDHHYTKCTFLKMTGGIKDSNFEAEQVVFEFHGNLNTE